MKPVAAAFVFFTRLPLWKLKAFNIPVTYFKQVISYWAVVGWLTAGVMAGVLWLSAQLLPFSVAVVFAIVSRVLLTGALHEDGLADFFDGFGGGTTKERTLEIMKDSHIGTYGVLALILYFLLFYQLLVQLPLCLAIYAILAADPLCKLISSFIPVFLPYARTEEASKAKVVYSKTSLVPLITSLVFGLAPFFILIGYRLSLAILFPVCIFVILTLTMKRKIQGYTGDCCGAIFLLTELSCYLGLFIVSKFLMI